MRQQKHREVNNSPRSHSEWWDLDLNPGSWAPDPSVLSIILYRLPLWKQEKLKDWKPRPSQCLRSRVRGSHHSLCWVVPFTSMVAFALGALRKWYTQWYSPESSALGLLILQRWEEKSSKEAGNSQNTQQKENQRGNQGPCSPSRALTCNSPPPNWKQKPPSVY